MPNFKIAVAQIPSVKGNVSENTDLHIKAAEQASKVGVSYLVFPELSLTGYEPELAASLAFSVDDERWQPLVDAANKHNVTLVVGAPLKCSEKPNIAVFVIEPAGSIKTYSKMNLHPGEDVFFAPGEQHHLVSLDSVTIANAICADTNNPQHAEANAALGASVYVAGVLITAGGYEADTQALETYAKDWNMLVAVANHNAPTGGWEPIGQSAIWTKDGLLARALKEGNAIVIAEQLGDDEWQGEVVLF